MLLQPSMLPKRSGYDELPPDQDYGRIIVICFNAADRPTGRAGGGTVSPIAQMLEARSISLIFTTGTVPTPARPRWLTSSAKEASFDASSKRRACFRAVVTRTGHSIHGTWVWLGVGVNDFHGGRAIFQLVFPEAVKALPREAAFAAGGKSWIPEVVVIDRHAYSARAKLWNKNAAHRVIGNAEPIRVETVDVLNRFAQHARVSGGGPQLTA